MYNLLERGQMPEGHENKLREIRQSQGRTVNWLAEQIGRTRGTIYAIEDGTSAGSLETWVALAKALDVPLDELSSMAAKQIDEVILSGKA
jgi:DNA-binding XRE family transcriptional regulator